MGLLPLLRAVTSQCFKGKKSPFSRVTYQYCFLRPLQYKKNLCGLQFQTRSLLAFQRPVNFNQQEARNCYWCRTTASSTSQRFFHTSQPRKALPPVIYIVVQYVSRVLAFLFGRRIRIWWKGLPDDKKMKVRSIIKDNRHRLLGFLGVLSLGVALFIFSHIKVDPLTNRSRFVVFSQKDMSDLSDSVVDLLLEADSVIALPGSHALYRRVEKVLLKIMKANHELFLSRGVHKWRILVIEDRKTKNAMVLPNGTVIIYSGMLEICDSDDQLAVVLSHEVSHALLNHQGEMLSREQLADAFLLLVIVMLSAVLPDVAALVSHYFARRATDILIHLPFSRKMEMEADSVGLKLLAKACYDVREASAFWGKMSVLSDSEDELSPFEFLSTHPAHNTREKLLDDLIPEASGIRDSCQCPNLSSIDPRQRLQEWKKRVEAEAQKKKNNLGVTIQIRV